MEVWRDKENVFFVRLQEISMSEHDHNAFTQLRARIHKQVEMLKAILESTQVCK